MSIVAGFGCFPFDATTLSEGTTVHRMFDMQPALTGETLALRPLQPDDLGGLSAAAAVPEIWAGHPAKDRYKPDVFARYFDLLLRSGTALVIIHRTSNTTIGCSRYYVAPDRPEDIAIGFTFLNIAFWGGDTNRELKRLMLGHAFATYPAVWFHIDPSNIRSQRATAKLGAKHIYDATLDLSGQPAAWMCFRLDRESWADLLVTNGDEGAKAAGIP